MPRSVHFDLTWPGEQDLLRELTREAIHSHGLDLYYLPRRQPDRDNVFAEDDTAYFDRAYLSVFYLDSVLGFEGEASILSKLGGMIIQDMVKVTIDVEDFADDVTAHEPLITRPREGDLIYLIYNQRLFQVRYVDIKPEFYTHGILTMYKVEMTLFEYSSERINTGIEEVDSVFRGLSSDTYLNSLRTEVGYDLLTEVGDVITTEAYEVQDEVDDSFTLQQEADDVVDWSEKDPFGSGNRY